MNPVEKARQQIDAMLIASGRLIQNCKSLNLSAGQGVAVREVPLKTGPCDYLLLVDRKPVGTLEAKEKGERLSTGQPATCVSPPPIHFAKGIHGSTDMNAAFPIPTGLHRSAQGCRGGETTLGNVVYYFPQPQQGCDRFVRLLGCNPFRVDCISVHSPRVARAAQPWADGLLKRDKVNLDIFWLKDEAMEESANRPRRKSSRRKSRMIWKLRWNNSPRLRKI